MDVIVKLPRADNMKDLDKLRKIYNSLETSVRKTSFGTLLISIIFHSIPFLISRKFKNNVFNWDNLAKIF